MHSVPDVTGQAVVAAASAAPQSFGAEAGAQQESNQAHIQAPLLHHTTLPFTWEGSPWRLVPVCLFNAAMTLITVGIYNFWGRTEIRRRTWNAIRLLGDPLVYHGTGRELFRGFMTVFALILVPILILGTVMVVLYGQASAAWGLYQAGLFLIVYPVLKAIATYRARRYRLSRTAWRGITGRMTGSSTEFAAMSWITALLYPLTLGWIAPWRQTYLQKRLSNATELGNHTLVNLATSGPVYLPYAVLWVGTIVLYFGMFYAAFLILGPEKVALIRTGAGIFLLSRSDVASLAGLIFAAIFIWSLMSSFYRATLYNRLANNTYLVRQIVPVTGSVPTILRLANPDAPPSDLKFQLKVRGPALIWLFVTNQLITYLSLFILKPVAVARTLKYYTEHLELIGPFRPHMIGPNAGRSLEGGEGLAQAFDLDGF